MREIAGKPRETGETLTTMPNLKLTGLFDYSNITDTSDTWQLVLEKDSDIGNTRASEATR